jgi:hypothetical protein
MGNLQLDMKIGDTRPKFVTPVLDSDGAAISLSGASAVLNIQLPDQTLVTKTLTIDSPATNGIVSYQWLIGDLPVIGDYKFEVQVTFGDGTKQTFPPKDYGTISVHADLD